MNNLIPLQPRNIFIKANQLIEGNQILTSFKKKSKKTKNTWSSFSNTNSRKFFLEGDKIIIKIKKNNFIFSFLSSFFTILEQIMNADFFLTFFRLDLMRSVGQFQWYKISCYWQSLAMKRTVACWFHPLSYDVT